MLEKVINVGLLKHPLNWFTVILMVVIFGIAADVVFRSISTSQE